MLSMQNISYSYKNNDKKVLNNINVDFEEGKFYTIVGASGSGKTTLLSLLAGLDYPTGGQVMWNKQDIKEKGLNYHRKHTISLVFQSYNLIEYLTPIENVSLGGQVDEVQLLERVGIQKEDMKRNVMQLSGGQQQRVAIARALASDAKVLLADEPTGNLDEETAKGILDLLKETAHKEHKCVIVVTHSQALADSSDVVLKMNNGHLIQYTI